MRRILWVTGLAVLVVVIAMQSRNPQYDVAPVHPGATFQASLHPDAHVQKMLDKSCASCHSAARPIPWYGYVWPVSRLVERDVRRGRARLDFSTWSELSPEMARIRLLSACQMMRKGRMPLWYYRPLHPGSAPKDADVSAFCKWAQAPPTGQETALLQ
jgi:hypothetical protein